MNNKGTTLLIVILSILVIVAGGMLIYKIINEKEVSNETNQLRQIIHNDIFAGPSGLPRERSIGRGDLSRFYNNKKNKF